MARSSANLGKDLQNATESAEVLGGRQVVKFFSVLVARKEGLRRQPDAEPIEASNLWEPVPYAF